MKTVMKNDFLIWQKVCHSRIDALLKKKLTCVEPALEHFFHALQYASIESGKRIRAMLTFASGAYLEVPEEELEIYAVAIELIHAFSLVHDDLPAMDNDILRRGKPTCHVAFGEGTAILAGDGLLTEAFLILSSTVTPYFNSLKRIKMIAVLAAQSGPNGMAGGQYLDLHSEKKNLVLEELLLLHRLKTGALIEASIELPLIYAAPSQAIYETLRIFAQKMGLIFQIQDDLLDIKKTSDELGKTAGKDISVEKSTFPRLLGQTGTEDFLVQELNAAKSLLDSLPGDSNLLQLVFEYIHDRQY